MDVRKTRGRVGIDYRDDTYDGGADIGASNGGFGCVYWILKCAYFCK